ncbi:PEP/pyruvate-binding domain-containing protein [Nonomuraea pusilla]|uniref:PEP/pyruvate-binding domain-containing protein n=1 Tax=Nonomuraea pusilla TaxID=46177 RepID=UPI003327C332
MAHTADPSYTFAFDCGAEPDHDRLGGKCASLVRMTAARAPVPPGFAVTTDAFAAFMDAGTAGAGLRGRVAAVLRGLTPGDVAEVDAASAEIRGLILDRPVPGPVRAAFDAAYERLALLCGGEVAVAVRSSATAEDLPDASFAGQQDSYLWVRGRDEVARRVRECWASLYTSRAITYRLANGIPDEGLSMAVGVQKMVDARAAGVAMTLDPGTGDRSKIVVDASWGVGEPVVSGTVTPDNFVLDKVVLSVVRRTVSDKTHELVLGPGDERPALRPVEDARRTAPSLTDDELLAVARLAKAAERHYRVPQDIEWAVDRHLPDGENVVLLQSRPETVWSRRPASPRAAAGAGAGVLSITRTLLAQVGPR